MPTLLLHYPEKEKRWKVEVQKDHFTVGRSREVDVCVPHTSVSKRHLAIEKRGPRYFFRDLGSKNGIYWNDFRRSSGPLSDGDELRIGSIVIKFYGKEAPPDRLEAPAPGSSRLREEGAPSGSTVSLREPLDAEAAATREGRAEPAPDRRAPIASRRPRAADPEEDPLLAELPASLDDVALPATDNAPAKEAEAPDGPRELPATAPAAEDESLNAEEDAPGVGEKPVSRLAAPRSPAREPARRMRRWLSPAFLLAAAGAIGAGILLGYLASLIEKDGEDSAGPAASPAAGGELRASSPAPVTAAPAAAATAGTSGARAKEGPLGPPARLVDPETRRRLAVRLHLDLAGRPPTRDELRKLEGKADLETLWYEIAAKGGAREIRARGVEAIFPRFLGREARPIEKAELLALAGNDIDHLAFLVGTSEAYASAKHRRKRTKVQLARSLITDLLGVPPEAGAAAKAAEELRRDPQELAAIARAIAGALDAKAGPLAGEPIEAWLEETYARLLLRKPTGKEREKALADLKARPETWRAELLGLVLRAEYLTY